MPKYNEEAEILGYPDHVDMMDQERRKWNIFIIAALASLVIACSTAIGGILWLLLKVF